MGRRVSPLTLDIFGKVTNNIESLCKFTEALNSNLLGGCDPSTMDLNL
jgi:hypothetical protein